MSIEKNKKTETPTSALGGTAVREQRILISSESPTISISGFLEHVKTIPIANVFFSEDVVSKMRVTRSKGTPSKDLRYALPNDADKVTISKGPLK